MKRIFLVILLIFASFHMCSQKGCKISGKTWSITNLYNLGKPSYDLMNKF